MYQVNNGGPLHTTYRHVPNIQEFLQCEFGLRMAIHDL